MDCFINGGMYLRANGTLYCGCDTGAFHPLKPFDPKADYFEDVFLGPKYRYVRDKLQAGQVPFPEICNRCAFLGLDDAFDVSCAKKKKIKVFHLEPSFACMLECPSCTKIIDRPKLMPRTEAGHLLLEPSVLEKVVADLADHEVEVGHFQVEGHGEPLLNRNVWLMIDLIRKYYPKSLITMTTNAQTAFKPEMADSKLDELVFALDGVDQATYSTYRRKGDFDKSLAFVRAFTQENNRRGKPIKTVWKYVVFKHNDDPAHLIKAQELAREMGLSEIVFILTALGPVSDSVYRPDQVPVLEGGVPIEVKCLHLPIDQFRKRIVEAIDHGKRNFYDTKVGPKIYDMCACLFSKSVGYRKEQYDLLKGLVQESAGVDMEKHALLLVLHDMLVRNGVFKGDAGLDQDLYFDEAYYLAENRDVAAGIEAGTMESAFYHYSRHGRMENRKPYRM